MAASVRHSRRRSSTVSASGHKWRLTVRRLTPAAYCVGKAVVAGDQTSDEGAEARRNRHSIEPESVTTGPTVEEVARRRRGRTG